MSTSNTRSRFGGLAVERSLRVRKVGGFDTTDESDQRLKNRYLLLLWLTSTMQRLEQDWCQYNVSGWGVMFICEIYGTSVYWHKRVECHVYLRNIWYFGVLAQKTQ